MFRAVAISTRQGLLRTRAMLNARIEVDKTPAGPNSRPQAQPPGHALKLSGDVAIAAGGWDRIQEQHTHRRNQQPGCYGRHPGARRHRRTPPENATHLDLPFSCKSTAENTWPRRPGTVDGSSGFVVGETCVRRFTIPQNAGSRETQRRTGGPIPQDSGDPHTTDKSNTSRASLRPHAHDTSVGERKKEQAVRGGETVPCWRGVELILS